MKSDNVLKIFQMKYGKYLKKKIKNYNIVIITILDYIMMDNLSDDNILNHI